MNNLELAKVLLDEATRAYREREEYKKKNGRYPYLGDGAPKARVVDNLKLARRFMLLAMDDVRRQ